MTISLFEQYKTYVNPTEYLRLRDAVWTELREGRPVYPHPAHCFRAPYETPLERTKVVIIGLDPYFKPDHAVGLSFAIPQEIGVKKLPSSLLNIKRELLREGTDLQDYTLSHWTQQGVLLLNAKLSVGAVPQSHAHLDWEKFTGPLLTYLSEQAQHPLVFILLGSKTQRFAKKWVKDPRHIMLQTTHPCRYSACKGFLGSGIFSQANRELKRNGLDEIRW